MDNHQTTTWKLSDQAQAMAKRLREFDGMRHYAPVNEAADLLDALAEVAWKYEGLCK